MAIHLVTGYGGSQHITAKDQGSFNIGTMGAGSYVLNKGNKFGATIYSSNIVKIADGDLIMQGRHIRIADGTTEEVSLAIGTVGKVRNDLIVVRYTKAESTGVESASLVAITGTEADSNPVDPAYNTGNITTGSDTTADFPLYRIPIVGLNPQTPVALFGVVDSLVSLSEQFSTTTSKANANQTAIANIVNGTTTVAKATIADSATTAGSATTATSATTANTATSCQKLATARTINGVAFDGSSNITITDNTKVSKDVDFILINKQALTFNNLVCTITDARITADSLADVYFTSDCITTAEKAVISVETSAGSVALTASRVPEDTLTATIHVRVI